VDCAAFLRVSKKQLEAIDPVFTLTIKEIMHVEPAEINQNFFDELYGKDAVTSEDVFAEKVRDEINNEMASKSEHRFVTDVRNLLLQRAALELPEVFLKRWLLLTSEGKLTKEELEKEFPAFAENLRWQLIEEHILKEGNIELKEEDLLFVARQMVLRRLAMYGVNNMIEERLTEFARTMLNRSEDRSTIAKLAAEHRVIEYVRDTVTVEKKEVSHEHLKSLLAAS
ncbi:MAG: hypothetical protein LBO71_08225, partial [Prevotellaceae bacterium]|nr:hypothetical protein [Prevotellaceae bacterium]